MQANIYHYQITNITHIPYTYTHKIYPIHKYVINYTTFIPDTYDLPT